MNHNNLKKLNLIILSLALGIQAYANDSSGNDCSVNAKKAALEIVKINIHDHAVQPPYVSSVWSPYEFYFEVFVVTDLGGESYAHSTVNVETSQYCRIDRLSVENW